MEFIQGVFLTVCMGAGAVILVCTAVFAVIMLIGLILFSVDGGW